MSIPVICDRCRSTGLSGEADFSHLGDLLAFTPVPRKKERVDGWSADKQRAFVAALSATGSKRRAAHAVGMAPFGIDQMLKADGNESFKEAVERALLIARAHGSIKIAQGVADAAARNAQLTPPSRLRGLPPEPEQAEPSEDQKWEVIVSIATKFMRKVAAERTARLAGQVVAADFYLRQITFLEVLLELSAERFGFNPRDTLTELRRGRHDLMEIVSTDLTDLLDASRRIWWAQEGEPDRPPHPDVRFLEQWGSGEDSYATNADQHSTGPGSTPARDFTTEQWAEMSHKEQAAARERQFEEDAEEQRLWEVHAREQAARRQGQWEI